MQSELILQNLNFKDYLQNVKKNQEKCADKLMYILHLVVGMLEHSTKLTNQLKFDKSSESC